MGKPMRTVRLAALLSPKSQVTGASPRGGVVD